MTAAQYLDRADAAHRNGNFGGCARALRGYMEAQLAGEIKPTTAEGDKCRAIMLANIRAAAARKRAPRTMRVRKARSGYVLPWETNR